MEQQQGSWSQSPVPSATGPAPDAGAAQVSGPDPQLDFLQVSADDVLRWDREWVRYLARVEGSRYFTSKVKYTTSELAAAKRLRTLPRDELYAAKGAMSALRIWYDGADLADRKVAELGCGPSQLGRDLSPVVSEYVGIDYSDLALSIARLTCAPNCRFFNLRDKAGLRSLRGKLDVVVTRHFFIHQNLTNARWVLKLANYLLKPGGVIVADFYWPDAHYEDGVKRGSIRMANEELREFASSMFLFTEEQIHSVVDEAGFDIEAEKFAKELPRRYVRLIKR